MLKWLQSGVYHTSNVNDIITDDPLATLNFKDEVKVKKIPTQEIYSVSRTNPLYESMITQADGNESKDTEEQPKIKENNVMTSSSSGYSSNRVPLPQVINNSMAPDSILEVDSLEPDLLMDETSLEDSIQNVPAPVWPNVDKNLEETNYLEKDTNYVSEISFDKNEDYLSVSRNGTFVRSIQFNKPMLFKQSRVPRMLESQLTPIGEVQNDSKFMEDSIVTDALLQMTSFSSAKIEDDSIEEVDEEESQEEHQIKEDMDKVIAELTQAVIKSKNVSTLTRAMNSKNSLRNSFKKLKKKANGIEAVKDLWQQSGMKTNGRKLLTDSLSEEDERSNHHFNRKQPKRLKKQQVHPIEKSPSTSSSERTTPPYKQVLNVKRSVSLTSSTELYAEVYRTSSGESSHSPIYGAHVRQVKHSSDSNTATISDSSCSSPASSDRTQKKRVQFSTEVQDNEMTSERLLYDKLPMTSPPRKGQTAVIVDIAKLNADQGFGFNKYLPSDSNSSDDYHRQIFESPYFDYRRTHSRAGSIYSGSDLVPSKYEQHQRQLKNKQTIKRQKSASNVDVFWKGFAIFLLVTFFLAIVVSMTVYFIYRTNWL